MKILLVNKYHYIRGGSETYYFGLAELLKDAGHEVIFFAMDDEKNISCEQSKYFVSNVDFNGDLSFKQKIRVALRMVYSFEAKKKMCQLIEAENPDIIHINLFHRVLTASIVDAAKKYHIPVVFTIHDLNCMCPNHTMLDHGEICEACLYGNYWNCVKRVCFKESKLKCFMAALENWYNRVSGLYNKINLYISPSKFYRQLFIKSGLTTKEIVHMVNFLPKGTKYAVSGQRKDYILYYGRLSYEKGILTLVKAMQQVSAKLIIVGTGSEEQVIKDLINKMNLSDKVCMVGFQKGENLWKYVRESICVVVPSEWYEASGYTACEPQALGKPVVVTDIGGLVENVINGETGYVCESKNEKALAEAINKIVNMDDDIYAKMCQSCVANAKTLFQAEAYVDEIIKQYKILINEVK